jgi:hypothetical protein
VQLQLAWPPSERSLSIIDLSLSLSLAHLRANSSVEIDMRGSMERSAVFFLVWAAALVNGKNLTEPSIDLLG